MATQTENKIPPTGQGMVILETREESIAQSIANTAAIQAQNPQVDFAAQVIKPTVDIHFDMQEQLPVEVRERHKALIGRMMDEAGDPAAAEKLYWESRESLAAYPDIQTKYDDILLQGKSVTHMVGQFSEILKYKQGAARGDE